MRRVRVKICGITNWRDAQCAVEAGADLLGFNFYRKSPRYISPAQARRIVRRLPKRVSAVGVFVNEPEWKMLEIAHSVGLDRLQLHGDEAPAVVTRLSRQLPVIKAVRTSRSFTPSQLAPFKRASAILLDGFDRRLAGGTGRTFDWRLARRAKRYGRIFLAGGLAPENVGEAIRTARPYAVDVSSGIERRPGRKNPERLRAFVGAVEAALKRKVRR